MLEINKEIKLVRAVGLTIRHCNIFLKRHIFKEKLYWKNKTFALDLPFPFVTEKSDFSDVEYFNDMKSLKLNTIIHFKQILMDHLVGVARNSKELGGNDILCKCCLFHSIYGTQGFPRIVVGLDCREHIQKIIGKEAELLVYLFCTSDRRQLYIEGNNILKKNEFLLKNFYTKEEVLVSHTIFLYLYSILILDDIDHYKYSVKNRQSLIDIINNIKVN